MTHSLRILILRATPIHPDPWIEKIGCALAAAGHSVTALGWDRAGSLAPEESGHGFPIRRLRAPAGLRRGLGRLPGLARWQAGLLGWLRQHHAEFDVLHACDFDTLPAALAAKRLWGLKVVYEIFDLTADRLHAAPRLVRSALRRADLISIGQADAVILADESHRARIAGARPPRLQVIYDTPQDCLAELQRLEPAPRPPEVRLRLAYSGQLQVGHGLLPLLEVLGAHPEWTLDLAGPGAEKGLILREARQLPNVTYHGELPYPQTLELAYAADVLPALYDPALAHHRLARPNELFVGMMLGRPLLAARQTGFDSLFEQVDCGLVVDYGDVAQLARALALLEDAGLRQRLGQAARRAYEQAYSWDKMAARLANLYQDLV